MTAEPTPHEVVPQATLERQLAALGAVELGGENLSEVLTSIAELVTSQLDAMGSGVVLWESDDDAMMIAASTIVDSQGNVIDGQVRDDAGLNRWIIETGRTVISRTPSEMPLGTSRVAAKWGVQAYLAVPIELRGDPLGVLYVVQRDTYDWRPDEVLFLETVARRAAIAMQNARLLEETRQARDRAEVLSRLGRALISATSHADLLEVAVEQLTETLGAIRAHIVIMDETIPRVLEHHIGGPLASEVGVDNYDELMTGLTGWALTHGTSLLSSKEQPDPRESELLQDRRRATGGGSMIVVPLKYRSRLLGTVTATRSPDEPDFHEDDVELVESMANLVAIEVVQSRMDAANETAANEVMALYQVAQALNREGGARELLHGLAEAVVNALGADRVTLYVVDTDKREVLHSAGSGTGALAELDEVSFDDFWDSMAGWVLRNRRSALLGFRERDQRESDAAHARRCANGPTASLIVPLFHSGKPLGALMACNGIGSHEFSQADANLAGAMGSQMSIALANALLFEETQRLAVTDELTGIHNRRQLFVVGEREVRAARRYGRPLAGILFDIDNFKRVNDTYGHAVGDEVLGVVVDRCSHEVREVDVFGRYGGEEFAVVLPETGLKKAIEVGERLREAVAAEPIATSAGHLPVTISVGVAAMSSDMQNVQALLDRADAAMFAAKHKGRNLVQSA